MKLKLLLLLICIIILFFIYKLKFPKKSVPEKIFILTNLDLNLVWIKKKITTICQKLSNIY